MGHITWIEAIVTSSPNASDSASARSSAVTRGGRGDDFDFLDPFCEAHEGGAAEACAVEQRFDDVAGDGAFGTGGSGGPATVWTV